MTRTAADVVHPKYGLTAEEQAKRLEYDDSPKHAGIGCYRRSNQRAFEVKVTTHFLRRATNSRKLEFNLICHKIHCSDRQLYDFIVLGTRQEKSA